jgi:hypothetical protein
MQGTQAQLDFILSAPRTLCFAAYAEEFGLIGNMLLIGGFLVLVFRGLAIALEGPTLFARLLAGSVTLIFFTYAFVNMGMVSGILPVVGVPLPFISYGGTAMVTWGLVSVFCCPLPKPSSWCSHDLACSCHHWRGQMGGAMARNLLARGVRVHVCDVDAHKTQCAWRFRCKCCVFTRRIGRSYPFFNIVCGHR